MKIDTNRKNCVLGRAALLMTTLLWGTSFVVLKDTLEVIPTLYVLAVRFSGAALLMLLLAIRSLKKLDAGYFKGGVLMGVALFAAYTVQTYGLSMTTPGKNAFLTATYCVIVPFLFWLINKQRPDKYNVIAAVLCIAGVGFVSLKDDFSVNVGDALTLCCGLFFGIHIILTGKYIKGRSVVLLTMIQFATAGILAWVSALLFVPAPKVIPSDAVWKVAYLCVMCTAACYVFQTYGQKYTPPTSTALIMTLESVLGAFFSLVLGYEDFSFRLIAGFALIFVSVVLAETKLGFLKRPRKKKTALAPGAEAD